ncbi:MAG: cytochrome-c peroxidase [Gammaproteobacteria bacterium]
MSLPAAVNVMRPLPCFLMLLVVATLPLAATARDAQPLATPDPATIVYPAGAPPTAAEIALGKTLFFDTRLSRNRTQSCATCHNPALGFGDGVALGKGAEGNRLGRNTPPLYNLAWNPTFFHDGRSPSLEAQALNPIESDQEMNIPLDLLIERLSAVDWYRQQFHAIYGSEQITPAMIGSALASFERTLVSRNSPFDRYLGGDETAMSESAKRGLKIFKGAAWCSSCHDGANFTDNGFHNIGVKTTDPGRGRFAPDQPRMQGAFKTPGLRNVELTAPYMHDGSQRTLEDVMQFYNRGGDDRKRRDPLIRELDLSKQDIADLVAFMKALTDPVVVEVPEIP